MFYFAFGSNLNHHRLHQRIGDYEQIGIGYLAGHKLVFNKCGGDGSGKCTVVENQDHDVWGTICQLNTEQKLKLDYFEGVGHGYNVVFKNIVMQDQTIKALLYQAQLDAMDDGLAPFDWYKEFVLTGARHHRFPDEYVKIIDSVVAIPDQDPVRAKLNKEILNGIYPS